MARVAQNLDEASTVLDGYKLLDPKDQTNFNEFYVPRVKDSDRAIIREAKAAHANGRSFLWFFSGHTGAGKSTELFRFRRNEEINEVYLPLYVNIEQYFDLPSLEYTDIILAMAKACESAANEYKCPIAPELRARINDWGKDIVNEEEIHTGTEGEAGIGINLVFFKAGEEIKSGGSKRTIIRERMFNDITGFIRLLDDMALALRDKTGKQPLCILDGLDHADQEPFKKALCNFNSTVTKPNLSKLFVIPLYSLMDTNFAPCIDGFHSTLPNIKVYAGTDSDKIDEKGFAFYKKVISRYANLTLFTDEALESLFILSAGLIRDMIRFTGDACGYAADDKAAKVEIQHADIVWYGEMSRLSRLISGADIEILKRIEENPRPQGADGISYLLHRKAIICYPNGNDWYGVHPALRRALGFSKPNNT